MTRMLEHEGEPIEGLEDDTPDDITSFLAANAIGEKYQLTLKEIPIQGGKPQYIKGWADSHPTVDAIGKQYGPGNYQITFSWKVKSMNGRKETVSKTFDLNLPEKAWREVHDEWLEERAEKKRAEAEKKMQAEAARIRAFGHPQHEKSEDSLDSLRKAAETLKSLGVPLGGSPPPKDWGAILTGMAPVLTALGGLIGNLIVNRGGDRNEQLLNLMVTKMLDRPNGESETMKAVVPFLMGTMKQMLEMKEAMKPEEKEPFLEKVFDKLVASMPMIMEFAKMTKEQREGNFMYTMARNSPEVQTILSDDALQTAFVGKLDAFYGFQQTNQILDVMGVARPPATAENERRYPSKDRDQKSEEAREKKADPQEALRAAHAPNPETEIEKG